MSYSITYVQTPNQEKPYVFTLNLDRIGFRDCEYYNCCIDIDKEQEYLLAVDQSMTSTGIAFASLDFSFVLVFTVVIGSKDLLAKESYVHEILEFIGQLLEGKTLKFLSIEAVPPSRWSRVNRELLPLKGAVEEGLTHFPSVARLALDNRFSFLPNVWKSTVYDKKDKRQGAFHNKKEIAKDIVKLYPKLSVYFEELQRTRGHDYDGFDAFGILLHTRVKCFTADWQPVNQGAKYQLGKFYVLFRYLTDEEVEDGLLLDPFSWWICQDFFDYKVWDSKESIYYNLVMAVNTNKLICMKCTNVKQILAFLIEFDVKYEQGKTLYLIVGKAGKNKLNDSQVEQLKQHGFFAKTYY